LSGTRIHVCCRNVLGVKILGLSNTSLKSSMSTLEAPLKLNKLTFEFYCFKENNIVGSEVEYEVPTWNQIYNMLLDLAEKIRKNGFKPDVIVGVSRGGWPPARVLSDLLGNPNLANVKAEFYLNVAETKEEPALTQPVSTTVSGLKALVTDEIADTGESLKLVKAHLFERGATEVKIATVYYKPWSIITPDYYEKKTSNWVIFPWERKETIRKIVKKCREEEKSVEKEKEKLVEAGMPVEIAQKFLEEILEEENC
jgi:hypoxanthine phosphoribosyltransferase